MKRVLLAAIAVAFMHSVAFAQVQRFKATVENVATVYPVLKSGVFNTPAGLDTPGPIHPGQTYEFRFTAPVGTHVSFATMFVQSNDLFFAPEPTGIPLFDADGNPNTGDVTDYVFLWDAGTEVNEEPGVGANQAPRQSGPNTGLDENGTIVKIADGSSDVIGYSYPNVADVIRVEISHNRMGFRVAIKNVSTGLSTSNGVVPIPMAPGAFAVHGPDVLNFEPGLAAPPGLEAIAEDGNPAIAADELAAVTGVTVPLSPGIFAVHGPEITLFNGWDPAPAPLEPLAEDGNPGAYPDVLSSLDGVREYGVFNTPVGDSGPGPLFPGHAYSFEFDAEPGDYFSFVTMYVQSNDMIYAFRNDHASFALFDETGNARLGDITEFVSQWDAGTEHDEEPGVGPHQAPRQSGPNSGDTEDRILVLVNGTNDGYSYPAPSSVIKVTLEEVLPPEPVDFYVRIENVSGGSSLPTPFAPGPWLVHRDTDPLFTEGEADRGQGLEAVAEDGNPDPIAESLSNQSGILSSGVFDTPLGSDAPGPLVPGSTYEFAVSAVPGDRLNFATMFVQSNDLFYAPDGMGIALFDENGEPRFINVTAELALWDAGTEVNEEPGVGANQAPRQPSADTGEDENGSVVSIADGENDVAGYGYPNLADVISVTISAEPSTAFTVVIENVSTNVPLSPGAWAVHRDVAPLFKDGEADRGAGLERLAEDGNPAELVKSLRRRADVRSSGVFDTPMGMDSPTVILPGDSYQFTVHATPGDRLSFATMFVQSNDLFYAPDPAGIALFDDDGQPMDLDLLTQTFLWDAGTEVNEEPGVGANQAPRQTGPDTGETESGVVTLIADGGVDSKGYSYPMVSQVVHPSVLGGTSVGIETDGPGTLGQTGLKLNGNFPNPFSGSTTIGFEVLASGEIQVDVFNLLGRKVATVFTGAVAAGEHQLQWDARDATGAVVPSGLYFYRLSKAGEQQTGSMSVVR